MKNKLIGIAFTTLTLLLIILFSIDNTRLYGFLLFGFVFVVSGMFVCINRLWFDLSEKVIVLGTLVKLEYVVDGEGYSSYRLHYQYTYQDICYIFKSQFTSFWYKKTKKVGEVISIAVSMKKPNNARIYKPIYTALEYLTGFILIIGGLFFALCGPILK